MRIAWTIGTFARVAWAVLPESMNVTTRVVRLGIVPAVTGLFYLAISSGGGRSQVTPPDAVAAALAAGSVIASVAVVNLIAIDRLNATLPFVLLARARVMSYAARFALISLLGVSTSAVAMVPNLLMSGGMPAGALIQVVLCLTMAAPAVAGMSFLFGAISLALRDALAVANAAEFLLPLLVGAVASVKTLPPPVAWISNALPVTHVVEAGRIAAARGDATAFLSELVLVGVLSVVWGMLGVLVWSYFERRALAGGSVEAFAAG